VEVSPEIIYAGFSAMAVGITALGTAIGMLWRWTSKQIESERLNCRNENTLLRKKMQDNQDVYVRQMLDLVKDSNASFCSVVEKNNKALIFVGEALNKTRKDQRKSGEYHHGSQHNQEHGQHAGHATTEMNPALKDWDRS